jgi:hypothetical protein
MYEASPDGRRFLMLKPAVDATTAAPATITVVLNRLDELQRRVPSR